MKKDFTHEDLRIMAMRWCKRLEYQHGRRLGFGCGVVASECSTAANDIPDVIGWRMGYSYLMECKSSRSDFLADSKKPQRNSGTGMANYRYYFTPNGLLAFEDVPLEWGLIEVQGREMSIAVECKLRELDAPAQREEKVILLSLIRRIKQREFLIIQDERTGEPCPKP